MIRPVMTQAQVTRLNEQIMSMTSADTVQVSVKHTARVVTHLTTDRVMAGDDGDELEINILTQYGGRESVRTVTNQITESTLRALIHQCETLAQAQLGTPEELRHVRREQDQYLPVALWHESTIQAMHTTRETVLLAMIDHVTRQGFRATGFVGLMARSQALLTKEGITAFGEETDCEVTVTARSADAKRVGNPGWAGHASRDWSTVNFLNVAERAVQLARMGQGAQAIEPGRRTAILTPAAVVQLARYFAIQFDAGLTDDGGTGFSRPSQWGNRIGQRLFDPKIQMRSDPADPDGGYCNYFSDGFANPKMTWIRDGVLVNLAYDPYYAMTRGKAYCEDPASIRIEGGPSSIEAMIASCAEGVYVNRFSAVELLDRRTGLMTGITNGGCFLVKNGTIDRPVKNFRFVDSPFYFLNALDQLGPAGRAPFGDTPPSYDERFDPPTWPRRPMIVPSMMVRDFNFTSLADAT